LALCAQLRRTMASAGVDFSSLAKALDALQDELKCSIWCGLPARWPVPLCPHTLSVPSPQPSLRRSLSLMHQPVSKLKCNHYFCG
jgi:hypothetical protein